jgi:hypothetical protein
MYIAKTFKEIDYDLINSKLNSGVKLRFDIGTSICSPVTKFWLDNCSDKIFVIGFDPNPDCVYKENLWNGSYMNIPNTFKHHPKTDYYYHVIGALDNVDVPTKAKFYRTTYNVGCSSLLKPIIENIQGCTLDDEIDVDLFAAKDILDNINFDYIELVKIDAQGKDLDIVKSFGRHLEKIVYLDVESDSSMYYEGAPNNQKINEDLSFLGFELYHNMHYNLRYKNKSLESISSRFSNITGAM